MTILIFLFELSKFLILSFQLILWDLANLNLKFFNCEICSTLTYIQTYNNTSEKNESECFCSCELLYSFTQPLLSTSLLLFALESAHPFRNQIILIGKASQRTLLIGVFSSRMFSRGCVPYGHESIISLWPLSLWL